MDIILEHFSDNQNLLKETILYIFINYKKIIIKFQCIKILLLYCENIFPIYIIVSVNSIIFRL